VGMDELMAEKKMLLNDKKYLDVSNENEKRVALNFINAKLQLLNRRIAEARIINLKEQPQNEVRFGAVITLKIEATNNTQTFQIVGVNEVNISKGKISFTSPLAKVLINKKVGDKAI
jgi:transcription elongation factor GreB